MNANTKIKRFFLLFFAASAACLFVYRLYAKPALHENNAPVPAQIIASAEKADTVHF
jgi:hypothetical protein